MQWQKWKITSEKLQSAHYANYIFKLWCCVHAHYVGNTNHYSVITAWSQLFTKGNFLVNTLGFEKFTPSPYMYNSCYFPLEVHELQEGMYWIQLEVEDESTTVTSSASRTKYCFHFSV